MVLKNNDIIHTFEHKSNKRVFPNVFDLMSWFSKGVDSTDISLKMSEVKIKISKVPENVCCYFPPHI